MIEDPTISDAADELFKKFYNVGPSCEDCAETLANNPRKKLHLGKRRREGQLIGGAIKKQKLNPITQEDVDNVGAEVQEAGPILEEPPPKWIEVMRKWWKKLRDRRN